MLLDVSKRLDVTFTRASIYPLVESSARSKDLSSGRYALSHMCCIGLDSLGVLSDQLIRLFGSCGSLFEANLLFCRSEAPSVLTWHAIITAHVAHEEYEQALLLFHKMVLNGIDPDKHVYTSVLRACASMGALEQGRLLHGKIVSLSLERDVVVLNSLIDLYGKCKVLNEAYKVFIQSSCVDVISWSSLIAGYAQHGDPTQALKFFQDMRGQGIKPDRVSYLSILKACCSVGALSLGKAVHDQIILTGIQSNTSIGNALIDMYIKCGSLAEAEEVFENLPQRDVVSWATIISGFLEHGRGFSAVDCFYKMLDEGINADRVTFLFLLKACGSVGAKRMGKVVHEHIIRNALEANVVVGSSIIDMYAKFGRFEEAYSTLIRLRARNTISWNALISGYADRGNYKMSIKCFEDMKNEGLQPTASTFTSILTACSHAGFVKEGYLHYESMINEYGITPISDHLLCLVDLFSRSGRLGEASEMLKSIPAKKDSTGWTSLLTACKKYSDVQAGQECFSRIKQMDPDDASCYMLMSSIYANVEMWDEYNKLQKRRQNE